MKTTAFPDYGSTVIRSKMALRRKRGYLSMSRKSGLQLPKLVPRSSSDQIKMDKLTWKATLRELFIMLLIAAVTGGALIFMAPYFAE